MGEHSDRLDFRTRLGVVVSLALFLVLAAALAVLNPLVAATCTTTWDGGAATSSHTRPLPAWGPYCSVTKRFRALMAMGESISPRRHASSQGAAHTRPQTEANGLGSRAVR